MTVKVVDGDILNCEEDIICHQTNCIGIMGGGVALQIRKKYPNVYEEYVAFCKQYRVHPAELLGHVQFCNTPDGKVIANCFGQNSTSGSPVLTNYAALEEALYTVNKFARSRKLTVAIPYNIGCGIAGGNWATVEEIINRIFGDEEVVCTLYKYNG